MEVIREQRLAAYAILVRDDAVLLVHWPFPGYEVWTLPGGGVEHGEDPYNAAIRETFEETGYEIVIERLLGVHSARALYPRADHDVDMHHVRVLYAASVVGGSLRPEPNGDTDEVGWVPLSSLPTLPLADQVETAIGLWRDRPASGHAAMSS